MADNSTHPEDKGASTSVGPSRESSALKAWPILLAGLVLFHLSLWAGTSLWFPALGIGIALAAWLGVWVVLVLAVDAFITQAFEGVTPALLGSILWNTQIGLSWWYYARLTDTDRRFDEPRSAVLFLLLVPGFITLLFAMARTKVLAVAGTQFWETTAELWLTHALGIMMLTPVLLAVLTPMLVEHGLISQERRRQGATPLSLDWTLGELIEVLGLSLAAGILGIVLAILHARQGAVSWSMWGLLLLLVVWAGLRQGVRGGTAAASVAGVLALLTAPGGADPYLLRPFQGNLLAQCSVALLVGSSIGWIRASESRYRQIIGHIPVVLYSVRVPRWVPARFGTKPAPGHHKGEPSPGEMVLKYAEVTLVSPAARVILGCEAPKLLGQLSNWLEQIFAEDRERVLAALTQLCLQQQPVTCEYRLLETAGSETAGRGTLASEDKLLMRLPTRPVQRWVRDTLAPHYGPDGHLDGWEGVIEDITEQRLLAHEFRHTSSALYALVMDMPVGIYFVHAPSGQPLLVNNRARQLLGQREDLAAGLAHLSKVFRLHRPDGSEYPWEELPLTRSLRDGASAMAEDIVVHRADGRQIVLVSWCAPVDFNGQGKTDAAVWVLEDINVLKQVEAVRQARAREVPFS